MENNRIKRYIAVIQNKNSSLEKVPPLPTVKVLALLLPDHSDMDFVPLNIESDLIIFMDKMLFGSHESIDPKKRELVIQNILSDHRVFFLAERKIASRNFTINKSERKLWYSIGAFGHSFLIQNVISSSIAILEQKNPDAIFFDSTPHDFISWIFCKTAELLGIKTIICKQSPMHWRFMYVLGIESQKVITFDDGHAIPSVQDIELIDKLIKNNRSEYKKAEPAYEKSKNLKIFFYQHLLVKKKLRWLWLIAQIDLLSRWRTMPFHEKSLGYFKLAKYNFVRDREFYENISNDLPKKRKIIFFLHYQFERTSLPEGLLYCQQWNAILWIKDRLPPGFCLVIKEHPAMLRRSTLPTLRPPGFYSAITQLNDVYLIHPEIDSFCLIDNCDLVATLTGTVGFQALCRGKPVLAFGLASYRDHPSVISPSDINNSDDLLRFIETPGNYEDIKDYLINLFANTVGINKNVSSDDPFNRNHVKMSHALAIQEFFKN